MTRKRTPAACFSRMYWDARRLHMHGKNEEAKQAYSAAAENARQHGLEAEAVVAEALILAVDGELDQAEAKVGAALDDSRLRLPELAWFTRGWLEYRRKDYDRAIRFYRKALATPGFEVPGRARNNMGVAYARKGNYDRAIACYREALAEPKHDAAGDAWSNMGNALAAKKDYDQAIKCYRKALAIPGYGAFGNAWYGLGLVFAKKGRLHEAVENWKRAGALFRKQGADDFAERAEQKIAAAKVSPGRRSRKDEVVLAALPGGAAGERDDRPEDRIKARLDGAQDTKYDAYGRRYNAQKCEAVVLAILKGWGSAVSLLGEGGAACRGGGYLLKWRGKGIAIDPGFDFLKNLHEAGFHCREINAMVVSHNHTDHNDDLRSFDDIRYEMYKRAKDDEEKAAWRYVLLWDADTAGPGRFDPEEADHRFPDPHIMQAHRKGWEPTPCDLPDLPFRVWYFAAKHSADVLKAVGVRVECLNEDRTTATTVGFTCDTGFFKELCDKDHLGGCDILVAHMSEPDPEEYDDSDHVKKEHLGYRGVERLIKGCKPKLTVVGEFWAGITDLRIDLVQGLRALCETEAILPASIGLQVKPGTLEVRCTNCRKWIGLGDIRVGSPGTEFGALSYLCRHCRLG